VHNQVLLMGRYRRMMQPHKRL